MYVCKTSCSKDLHIHKNTIERNEIILNLTGMKSRTVLLGALVIDLDLCQDQFVYKR